MLDITNTKLSSDIIDQIETADHFYRNTDLELFAKNHEDELLNNKLTLFPLIFISPGINSFNDIKRVSINKTIREDKSNNRLFYLEDLNYPPKKVIDKLYYNRASYKRQAIFYGGFGDFEALFENSPDIGDMYTISTWRQKENTKLCYASIFHDQRVQNYSDIFRREWNAYRDQLDKLDQKTSNAIEKLFALITFFFIRPVEPSKKIEYLLSAHLANKIFNMPYSPGIEAILYPSVPMEYIASNLAILPDAFDNKFEFIKAEEFIVLNKTEGRNQWISSKIAETIGLSGKKLQWKTSYLDDNLIKFMKKWGIDLKLI